MAKNSPDDNADYSAEIIALLQDVGERLRKNESERKEIRFTLEDLENRYDQSENVFLSVHDRLSKTESAFSNRQDALEAAQLEQAARIQKAAAMADKIEAAMAQHAKINRRLDQAAQDKVRILQQLEKIEDTVIETQEALKQTAIVPMGKYEKRGVPQDNNKMALPPFMQKPSVRAAGVFAMIMLGVAGGWGLSKMNDGLPLLNGEMPAAQIAQVETIERDYAQNIVPDEPSRFVSAVDPIIRNPQDFEQAAQRAGLGTADNNSAMIKNPADTLRMSDEELVAAFDEDPDALASQLNDIMTAAGTTMPEDLSDVAEDMAATPDVKEEVAFTAPQKIKMVETADFLAAQAESGSLRNRIPPDTALPAVIKEVEAQAYDGIGEAQHDLAAIYTAGHGGVPVDFDRAAQWFKESALNGVANARYNLGVLYHQGLGVPQDIDLAVGWYRAAAEIGHPEAQYNLGIAFIEGIGTPYNPDKAAYYFEEAANGGVLEAAYNLGLIHENGLTGNPQPNEALYWYKKASDMGSPEAQAALDQLSKTMGLFPADIERLFGARVTPEKTGQADIPAEQTSADSDSVDVITAGALNAVDKKQSANKTASAAPQNDDFVPEAYVPNLAEFDESVGVVSTTIDAAIVAQLQEQLMCVGLYPGPPDGVYNNLTEDAIRSYQSEFDLKPDGRPTQALLVHMMTSDIGANEYGSRE